MSGRPVISEEPEESGEQESEAIPENNENLLPNTVNKSHATEYPIAATNRRNLVEIQRHLMAVDASERVLNATTTLLKAATFQPPEVYWEDIARTPESHGFWSTLRELPKEFLISFGVGFLAFIYLMASQLQDQFIWVVLLYGVFACIYAALEKFSKVHEVSAIVGVRAGQKQLVENVSSMTQTTALKMKEQTHLMHSDTLQAVKDVETIRANTEIAGLECQHKIATLNAGKDIKLKEIGEEFETTRAKLRNQNAKEVAEIRAKTTEEIEKGKQAVEQLRLASKEKLEERKMKNEKERHTAEQETRRRMAELDREKESKRIEQEALIQNKQIDADLNMHESKQRYETERKKIEADGATNRVREEYAYKTRQAEEETKRKEIEERGCIIV